MIELKQKIGKTRSLKWFIIVLRGVWCSVFRGFLRTLSNNREQRASLKNCFLQLSVVSCPGNINIMTSDVIFSSDKLFLFSS